MDKRSTLYPGIAALLACALAGCGQTGKLYLPDEPREIVTRPAAPPPPAENTEAPLPTPEAEEAKKKDKSAAPPPPK